MGWREVYENELVSGGQRFTYNWYLKHSITQELLNRDLIKGNVCEVASGLGIRALIFSRATNKAICGYDSDAWAIEFARREAEAHHIAAKFELGDFYSLPCRDESFDTVLFIAGIEHSAFPDKAIEELFRVTVKGGRVVMAVTLNDYHADPDHKSSFSENGVRSLLSSFGKVTTWIADNIIYAVLEKSRFPKSACFYKPKIVYADMRHPDTYTECWDHALQQRFEVSHVSFDFEGKLCEGEGERLCKAILDADVLHLGTGAIHIDRRLLEQIRRARPDLHISKWWGDVSPERYNSECALNSDIFNTLFISVSNYLGDCSPSCTQVHLNSPGVRQKNALFPFNQRPWDVGLFANAYTTERLQRFSTYMAPNKYRSIWYGDGSPLGRLSRKDTNQLIGLAKINLNIIDPEHSSRMLKNSYS